MTIESWDKNDDGTIKLFPFVEFETAHFQRQAALLRLVFERPEDRPMKPTGSLQVGMSAAQLRLLIEDLRRMLAMLDAGAPTGVSKN